MQDVVLDRLLLHWRWAGERVLEAMERGDGVRPDAIELLSHVIGTEETWLARLQGRPPEAPVWPVWTLAECGRWQSRVHDACARFTAALDADDLAGAVTYTNSAGRTFTSEVRDILVHVALHGTYHRGQIAAALRRAGREPAPTDYIAFRRGAPAATRRDAGRPQ